ncbi:DJ-1/PfpI family protein [Natranaeroarchaeum sulfidigenes]|uniref:Intracellular protease/amidase n=1 Tax=Natranaeroarchaeum sulfidigenes TaxID=2784880 RepID=A0A897MYA9_9EURY|nr:DJ-1/PfpI family protein [Natranaeroarchaeum sulfidigenes]QSG03335.1 Putative intracellular protease/amidase [Natranaeroarchaeum sulfidigenes]
MDVDSPATIEILCYDGFDELDVIGPFEVFTTAADHGCSIDVRLVTLASAERITASHGLTIEPDGQIGDDPDLLVVPGGGWNTRGEASAWALAQNETAIDAVRRRHAAGTTIAAVCTGGMILAIAGLLDGRPATTHASTHGQLPDHGAVPVHARVVDDTDLLTAGGVTAGIDLSLWIVEQLCGADVADKVATTIEHERSDDVHVTGRE